MNPGKRTQTCIGPRCFPTNRPLAQSTELIDGGERTKDVVSSPALLRWRVHALLIAAHLQCKNPEPATMNMALPTGDLCPQLAAMFRGTHVMQYWHTKGHVRSGGISRPHSLSCH